MSDTSLRDRLRELIDPIPIDVEGRLASVRGAPPRRGVNRAAIAAVALLLAAAALGFVIWAFASHDRVRPATALGNGRIAFVDLAPDYEPPKIGGQIPNTDIYTMNPDGSDVRQLTRGRDTDHHPSWSPDGARIAFTRGWQDGPWNVFVADADGSHVRQITFCRYAVCIQALAWSPRGDVIAYVRGRDIYLIHPDGTDNHLLYRCKCLFINLGWSPDGRYIAFTGTRQVNGDPGLLYVLDVERRTAELIDHCDSKTCHAGDRDAHPSWSPDGGTIAFSREGNIWLISPDGASLHRLTMCPTSGRGAFVCSREYPTWSPDGTKLLYERREAGIFVMNADGTGSVRLRGDAFSAAWQAVQASPASPTPTVAAAGQNAGLIAFSDLAPGAVEQRCPGCRSNTDIYVMDPEGGRVRRLTSGPEADLAPVWSPDGNRILFLRGNSEAMELWVANADGSGARQMTYCGLTVCVHGAAWSNDGTHISYWTQDSSHVIAADGSDDKVLCVGFGRCPPAATSPNGRLISYAVGGNPAQLYVARSNGARAMAIATCRSRRCVDAGEGPSDPAWSPDGTRIAFYQESNIWLVRPDGTDLRKITECTYNRRPGCLFANPTWAPDGTMIVFWRQSGIYVMSADGTGVRKLRGSGFLGSWQTVLG